MDVTTNPNPFYENLRVTIASNSSKAATIRLVNMIGQTIKTLDYELQVGENQIQFDDLDSLPAGVYILAVSSKNYNKTFKVLHVVQ